MILSRKIFLAFLFLLTTVLVYSQDLIYTVKGEFNSSSLSLDSIKVENISNEAQLVFGDLPIQTDYKINLSKGELEGPTGIDIHQLENYISLVKNISGNICISIQSNLLQHVRASVYNIHGQMLCESRELNTHSGDVIDVHLPGGGIYIVEVATEYGSKAYKAVGSFSKGEIQIIKNGESDTGDVRLKKTPDSDFADFSFQVGDSIRISVFRDGYYSGPAAFKISSSETLVFHFDISPEGSVPVVLTNVASQITQTSAIIGGKIINDGGLEVTEVGVYWGESSNPEINGNKIILDSSNGEFSTTLYDLSINSTYYFRPYAINSAGISFGKTESFTTRLNIFTGTKYLTLISVNNSWSTYEDFTWEGNFAFKENEYMQIFEICIWNTENPKVSLYMFDRNFEPRRVEFPVKGQEWVNYRESYNILNIETPAQSSQEYLEAFKLIMKKIVETQPAECYGIKYWGHSSGSSALFGSKIQDEDAENLLLYINSIISKKIDFLDWSRNCSEGRYKRIVKEYKYADYILASDINRMGYAMAGGAVESSQLIETFFSPSKTIRQSLIDMINQDRLHWESDFTKNNMITNKIKQSISIYDTDKFEDMVNSTNLQSTDYRGDVLEYIQMNYPSEVQKFWDFRFAYVSNKDFFTWEKDSNGFLRD